MIPATTIRYSTSIAFGLLLAAIALSLTAACSSKDDTAAIRKMIDEGAKSATDHQIGDLLALTTDDFKALPGNHDARSLKGILFVAFKHYGNFEIRYPRPTVAPEQDGKRATATVYFMIVSKDRPVPGLKELYDNPEQWIETASEKADLYQLKLDLVKEGSEWRVQQSQMEGFKGWGF